MEQTLPDKSCEQGCLIVRTAVGRSGLSSKVKQIQRNQTGTMWEAVSAQANRRRLSELSAAPPSGIFCAVHDGLPDRLSNGGVLGLKSDSYSTGHLSSSCPGFPKLGQPKRGMGLLTKWRCNGDWRE